MTSSTTRGETLQKSRKRRPRVVVSCHAQSTVWTFSHNILDQIRKLFSIIMTGVSTLTDRHIHCLVGVYNHLIESFPCPTSAAHGIGYRVMGSRYLLHIYFYFSFPRYFGCAKLDGPETPKLTAQLCARQQVMLGFSPVRVAP